MANTALDNVLDYPEPQVTHEIDYETEIGRASCRERV